MKQEEELALKVTKEIVIKFIETGRLSYNTFDEVFRKIYETVSDTLGGGRRKRQKINRLPFLKTAPGAGL